MEFVIELVVQIVGELFFQAIGEGLRRRWGKLVFGILLGFGGGWLWAALVSNGKPPVIVTVLVVVESLAVLVLSGRVVRGRRLDQRLLLEMTAIGGAVAVGRWVGYILDHQDTVLR